MWGFHVRFDFLKEGVCVCVMWLLKKSWKISDLAVFTTKETEAQREEVTCLRSHSKLVEQRLKIRISGAPLRFGDLAWCLC